MNKIIVLSLSCLSLTLTMAFTQTTDKSPRREAEADEAIKKPEYKVKQSYESHFTQWMSNDKFGDYYSKKHEAKYFPVVLEGRLISEESDGHIKGDWEYRAIFEKMPVPSFFYYVEWGRRQNKYNELAQKYKDGGYEILFMQNFKDVIDENVSQAIWVRKDQIPAAKKVLKKILE